MYSKPFYISKAVGNNAFSFESRKNSELFVPSLQEISSFDEIELLDSSEGKVTFEDYDFDDVLQTCYGLKNLYYFSPKTLPRPQSKRGEKLGAPIYLVDNHNHVFYFWYLARSQGIISDNSILYHIDEHADTRDSGEYLMKPDSENLQKVFDYTNFTLNVGNYIIPAQKEGLIGEVIQIRGEEALKECMKKPHPNPLLEEREQATVHKKKMQSLSSGGERIQEGGFDGNRQSVILNLDLDFFEPELDFIDYGLKKQVIHDIAQKADLITVCTSPFFIDQERALEVFRHIFK